MQCAGVIQCGDTLVTASMDGEIYGHRPACNGSMVVMTYRGKEGKG